MPTQTQDLTHRRRRRRRRVLGAVPTVLASWVVVTGLPFAPAVARAGTLHTEVITLTGPDGAATPAAGTAAGRSMRAAPTRAAEGWTATVDVEDGTQAVGLTWVDAETGSVSVRGAGADGWTPWSELTADPADLQAAEDRDAGGLAWFGGDGVDSVELRVDHGSLADLEVQTMRYEEPTGASYGMPAADAAAARPTIMPRSAYTSKGWAYGNSGCGGGPQTAAGGLKNAVIHHTVNSNTYSASDVPAMLAAIQSYHTVSNGWCDTAYNFLIDRFGRIWEGRSGGVDRAIIGGHAKGFNTSSMGVSFLGQYEPGVSPAAVAPTSAALQSAGSLIGWRFSLAGIDPTSSVTLTSGGSPKYATGVRVTLPRISGHRDVGLTACPGANLYSQLDTIRVIAKSTWNTPPPTTTTTTAAPTTTTTSPPTVPPGNYAPFPSVRALVTQQYRDILRRDPSSADLAYWGSRVGTSWSAGHFTANLLASPEADAHVGSVTRLYSAYFLRRPDHNGFDYWMGRRDQGRSLVSISASFAGSSEFRNRYGALSNGAFVDRVYRNVMDRPADAAGLTYWTRKLDAGTSRGQVMANFSQSTEYVRRISADVHLVGLYEGMLQRAIDGGAYDHYVARLNTSAVTLSAIATTIQASGEYRNRIT